MSIEQDIRRLYNQDADLTDVVGILHELLARIEALEAKLKEQQ